MQPVAVNPAAWGMHLHFQAYRALRNQIIDVAASIFGKIGPPIMQGIQFARKFTLFDFCYTSTVKAISGIAIKTLEQVRREQEIVQYRRLLGKETAFPNFCNVTAQFFHIKIPSIFAEKLAALPSITEGWAFFRLGLLFRYVNHQFQRKTNYRERFLESAKGKSFQGNYCGIRTRLAYTLLGRESLIPLVDFEHIFLQFCTYLNDLPVDSDPAKGIRLAIQCVGESLSRQVPIDRAIKRLGLGSDEGRLIARLEWHRKHQTLPRGIPDPRELTTSNLEEKLDEALYARVGELVDELLDQLPLGDLRKGCFGMVYFLEGKDLLNQALSYLLVEFGVKQLVDPHLFAMAILYSNGIEVAEYELDGFGRGTRETVLETGMEMMRQRGEQGIQIYEQSGLKVRSGGLERIQQQIEVKNKLRDFVASILYEMIKEEDFQHNTGIMKTLREKASKLPVVGMAAASLHLLINGTIFSFGYLYREKKHGETSFLSWMFKHFSGRDFCRFLADRIVALIYHPSWRITVMQLIDTFTEHYLYHPHRKVQPVTMGDFRKITNFIFHHFIRESSLPKKEKIARVFSQMAEDEAFGFFKEFFKPTKQPALEKGLEAIVPSIKEYILQIRVLDAFRKECVHFEGDEKFWEVFLREALNRLVEDRFASESVTPTLYEIASVRESFVNHMLSLGLPELRAFLSQLPKSRDVTISNIEFNLVGMIQEDYEVTRFSTDL